MMCIWKIFEGLLLPGNENKALQLSFTTRSSCLFTRTRARTIHRHKNSHFDISDNSSRSQWRALTFHQKKKVPSLFWIFKRGAFFMHEYLRGCNRGTDIFLQTNILLVCEWVWWKAKEPLFRAQEQGRPILGPMDYQHIPLFFFFCGLFCGRAIFYLGGSRPSDLGKIAASRFVRFERPKSLVPHQTT